MTYLLKLSIQGCLSMSYNMFGHLNTEPIAHSQAAQEIPPCTSASYFSLAETQKLFSSNSESYIRVCCIILAIALVMSIPSNIVGWSRCFTIQGIKSGSQKVI